MSFRHPHLLAAVTVIALATVAGPAAARVFTAAGENRGYINWK